MVCIPGQLKGQNVIAVGYENGDIKLFNVNNSEYLWETNAKDGVCSIDFDNQVLRIGTLAGAFVIDIYTGKITEIPVNAFFVHLFLFVQMN